MSINSRAARRWRRRAGAPLAVTLALLAGLVFVAVSSAQIDGSSFESSDGNLLAARNNANEITGLDWENIGIDCKSSPKVGCGIDLPTGQQDNSFGQGTKEDTATPTIVNGSIPNNKSDLLRFYLADEKENGDNFLYLAWERVQEPNGTTNMDFEFNQAQPTYDSDGELVDDGISANGVTPDRTAGDLLIRYDLSQGGTNPSFGLHRWTTSGSPATVCEASNTVPCWGKRQSLDLTVDGKKLSEGSVNGGTVTDPIQVTGQTASRTLSARTFGEAALNLTKIPNLFPADGRCVTFGRAYLKSRSSDSFTAALKDFIAPIPVNISNCERIRIVKEDGDGEPLSGATFQLYKETNGEGGWQEDDPDSEDDEFDAAVGDPCVTAPHDNDTPDNPDDDIAVCEWDVTAGTYYAVETAAPADYELPDNTVTTFVVDFDDDEDMYSTTVTNNLAPGDITITKTDDDGTEMNGITFTLHEVVPPAEEGDDPTVGDATDMDCVTAHDEGDDPDSDDDDTDGTCKIDSIDPGTYFLVETVPAGYDADPALPELITVEAGDHLTRSYTNDRRFTVVVFVCREVDSTLYPSTVDVDSMGEQTTLSSDDVSEEMEATLCALADAADENDVNKGRFEGLHALDTEDDPYGASVHIPR